MAIQGDRVSYCLALGFFVPCIVLESIDLLGNQPTWDSRTVMPAEKRDAVMVLGLMAAFFALALHIDLCLETMNFALKKSMFEAKLLEPSKFIKRFSPLVAAIGSAALKVYEMAPKDMRSQLVGITLFVGSSILLYAAVLDFIRCGDAGLRSRVLSWQSPLPSQVRSYTYSSIFALLRRPYASFSAAKIGINRNSSSNGKLYGPSLVSFSIMAISMTRAARISQLGPSGYPEFTGLGIQNEEKVI